MVNYSARYRQFLQHGGAGVGFVAGLLVGLLIALGVALYVTKAPIPLSSNKQSEKSIEKPTGSFNSPFSGEAPDPNKSLYNKDIREGRAVKERPDVVAPTTIPEQKASSSAEPSTPPLSGYYLQTGSFSNPEEADQLRARLALAGIEANVTAAQVSGKSVKRVRVGPFSSAEEAYRARMRLTENGFEARLVKPESNH